MHDSFQRAVRNSFLASIDADSSRLRTGAVVRALASDAGVIASAGKWGGRACLAKSLADEAEAAFDEDLGGAASGLLACTADVPDDCFAPDRRECLRRHFAFQVASAADIAAFRSDAAGDGLLDGVEVVGEEHLKDALGDGRGVMLVSVYQSHPGFLKAVTTLGGRTVGAVRHQPGSGGDSLLLCGSGSLFSELPASPAGARQMLQLLGEGELVAAYADYTYPHSAGVLGPLFGRSVLLSRAMVRLSIRTGAAVLPTSVVRLWPLEQDRARVTFFPPLCFRHRSEADGDDVRSVAVQLGLTAECLIRLHPSQWQLWNTVALRWRQARNWCEGRT